MTLPAGAAPLLHLHHDLDDSSFMLGGQMVLRCGDQMLLAPAGDWLLARDLDQARRQATAPPTGGPGLKQLSWALAEHDATDAGSSLSNEETQSFMAAHG